MPPVTWTYCQQNSDIILSEGLDLLRRSQSAPPSSAPSAHGNYLISMSTELYYIGEAKDLRTRLKQQFSPRTSTFHKNYLGLKKAISTEVVAEISTFEARWIQTALGRKELEEFGIVNLPANLNKFQLGKRAQFAGTRTSVWNEVQANAAEILLEGERIILASPAIQWSAVSVRELPGLYYVEHPRKGLAYIGESSNIRERYEVHSRETYFSALRRHVGEDFLGFELQIRNGKRRYFSDGDDSMVTQFLKECSIKTLPVKFARFELEEHLIQKYRPLLNRKDNR